MRNFYRRVDGRMVVSRLERGGEGGEKFLLFPGK